MGYKAENFKFHQHKVHSNIGIQTRMTAYSFIDYSHEIIDHGFQFWHQAYHNSNRNTKQKTSSAILHYLVNECPTEFQEKELEYLTELTSDQFFQADFIEICQNPTPFFLDVLNIIQPKLIFLNTNELKIDLSGLTYPPIILLGILPSQLLLPNNSIEVHLLLQEQKKFKTAWKQFISSSDVQNIQTVYLQNSGNIQLDYVLDAFMHIKSLEVTTFQTQALYDFCLMKNLQQLTWNQERSKGISRMNLPPQLSSVTIFAGKEVMDIYFPYGINKACKIRTLSSRNRISESIMKGQ